VRHPEECRRSATFKPCWPAASEVASLARRQDLDALKSVAGSVETTRSAVAPSVSA
jgi:hypothetical protein